MYGSIDALEEHVVSAFEKQLRRSDVLVDRCSIDV